MPMNEKSEVAKEPCYKYYQGSQITEERIRFQRQIRVMTKSKINLTGLEADFESRPERAFSQADLFSIFNSRRFDWNLPRSMSPQTFIDMLLHRTKMSQVSLTSPYYPPVLRYVWGANVAPVLLALSIKRGAFCSHGSAMWIHGLGGDEHRIFVNSEQSEKPPNRGLLTQDAIDRAFRNEQRKSKLIYKYLGATVVVLSGKNSGRLEVEPAKAPSGENVEVTSLERTLVDITVGRHTREGSCMSLKVSEWRGEGYR
jgi:hypothetical protein